ncbi:MAG: hypothetical protein LBP60_09925 [Spirochaetaceae bacterium]|jgi:hypothetical protein|nr:hypothetical protein [Spirochaetaceae bacterium]
MTPNNFIDRVRNLYLARKEKREIAPCIYRGTNPSVSTDTEDLFARYLRELADMRSACSIAQKDPPDIYFAGNMV